MYDAFKSFLSRISYKVSLRIIGSGPLKNKLRAMIRQDGLENHISLESKKYEEMSSVYRTADIFVLPSKRTKTWEEQYGMVLVEAMASGIPIVATRSGSIPEIVADAAILVGESDRQKLAQAILGLTEDEPKRQRLGRMGRERAEKYFDSRKTAKAIGRIYKRLM